MGQNVFHRIQDISICLCVFLYVCVCLRVIVCVCVCMADYEVLCLFMKYVEKVYEV